MRIKITWPGTTADELRKKAGGLSGTTKRKVLSIILFMEGKDHIGIAEAVDAKPEVVLSWANIYNEIGLKGFGL